MRKNMNHLAGSLKAMGTMSCKQFTCTVWISNYRAQQNTVLVQYDQNYIHLTSLAQNLKFSNNTLECV